MDTFYIGNQQGIYENISDPYELLDLDCYEVDTRCSLISLNPTKADKKILRKNYISNDKVQVYFFAPEEADHYFMWSYGTKPQAYSLARPEYADLLKSIESSVTGTINPNSVNLPPIIITYPMS